MAPDAGHIGKQLAIGNWQLAIGWLGRFRRLRIAANSSPAECGS